MALNRRQRKIYRYSINVYRQTNPLPGGDRGNSYTQVLANIPCYLEVNPETNSPEKMGRTKDDNMFTFDKFHMEMTVDIRDADFIELVGAPTTTHPFIGKYWAVKGGPDVAGYRANKLSVLAQQNESPAGL